MYSLVAAVILLTMGSRIKPWIEGAWRTTPLQKDGSQQKLIMISDCTACPSWGWLVSSQGRGRAWSARGLRAGWIC